MAYYVGPVANLINELHKLPGIGPKSAQRLAFFILQRPLEEARQLAESIRGGVGRRSGTVPFAAI